MSWKSVVCAVAVAFGTSLLTPVVAAEAASGTGSHAVAHQHMVKKKHHKKKHHQKKHHKKRHGGGVVGGG